MILDWLLDGVIAALLLGAAGWTLAAPRGVASVAGFVVFGLVLTLAWVRLDAVDVALTEAAIGAGATGLLLLTAVVRLSGGQEELAEVRPGLALRIAAGVLAGAIGLALAIAVLALPTPAPSLAAEARAQAHAVGLGNLVAVVLMAYRGLDTLLESVVLVFAVLAVWSMAPDRHWPGIPGPVFARQDHGPLALLARVLPPIGIVVGLYVMWVGKDVPGGKFQGGTILAAMWVLAWVAGLVRPPSVADRLVRFLLVLGPLAFILAGVIGMVAADAFLAWPAAIATPMIVLVEVAMTVSVAAAIALLVAGPPERIA